MAAKRRKVKTQAAEVKTASTAPPRVLKKVYKDLNTTKKTSSKTASKEKVEPRGTEDLRARARQIGQELNLVLAELGKDLAAEKALLDTTVNRAALKLLRTRFSDTNYDHESFLVVPGTASLPEVRIMRSNGAPVMAVASTGKYARSRQLTIEQLNVIIASLLLLVAE